MTCHSGCVVVHDHHHKAIRTTLRPVRPRHIPLPLSVSRALDIWYSWAVRIDYSIGTESSPGQGVKDSGVRSPRQSQQGAPKPPYPKDDITICASLDSLMGKTFERATLRG